MAQAQQQQMTPHLAPKILHQIWFNFSEDNDPEKAEVPLKLRPMQQSWVNQHPDWKYVLWSRPKADEFIARHFGWFLPTWQSYKSDIYRVDALRYLILYWYGGAYIDIDAECHKPLDELRAHSVVLVGTPHSKMWLSNYFMMAHRRHPFFLYCLEHLSSMADSGLHWKNSFVSTMTMAGPAYLTWCYFKYGGTTANEEIYVMHHCYFGAGREQCRSMLREQGDVPFADHQFHSSWGAQRRAWADIVRLLAALIGIIVVSFILFAAGRRHNSGRR